VNSKDEPGAAVIADEILAYLNAHPMASDTLDGVVRWWLIRSRYLRGLAQVQAGLSLLIERGLVVELIQPDDSKLYCAASRFGTSPRREQT
jgi:hypothetical protein